jgi:hypothetical protein
VQLRALECVVCWLVPTMPDTKKNITEIARDFAEGTELAAAIKARAPIAPAQDKSREAWVRRWLDLSEWARTRELRELDRELVETLVELRLAIDVAEQQATEAMYAGGHAQAFFINVVESHGPQGTSDIAKLFTETAQARDYAQQTAMIAADKRCEYAEAKGVVAVARVRSQNARQHFVEMRRVRIRAIVMTLLLTLVALVIAAALLHYRMHIPR